MEALTFTQSVLLALALGAVAAGIGLVFLGLLYGDGLLFPEGIWPKKKDTRPDVGVDIFDPRERGLADDITDAQAHAWADRLHAMLTEPDEDDLDHITYADATIAPSPLVSLRRTTDDTLQFAVAPGIEVHDHGRAKGDTTLMFEGIAEHEGHPVQVHGPDERARVIGHRRVRWAR